MSTTDTAEIERLAGELKIPKDRLRGRGRLLCSVCGATTASGVIRAHGKDADGRNSHGYPYPCQGSQKPPKGVSEPPSLAALWPYMKPEQREQVEAFMAEARLRRGK